MGIVFVDIKSVLQRCDHENVEWEGVMLNEWKQNLELTNKNISLIYTKGHNRI